MRFFRGLRNLPERIGIDTREEIQRRIISALDEKRGEMFAFITGRLMAEDPEAAEKLLSRLEMRQQCLPRTYGDHKPYMHGDKNRMSSSLTKIYIALDDPTEHDKRLQTFKYLGRLTDKAFDSQIEIVENDAIRQYVKRITTSIDKQAEKLADVLENARLNAKWIRRKKR